MQDLYPCTPSFVMIEMSLCCYISKAIPFPFPRLNSYMVRGEQEETMLPRAVGLRARDTELSEHQACVDGCGPDHKRAPTVW